MIELISWIIAWIILIEIIYLIIIKDNLFLEGGWIYKKIMSILISLMFLVSQLGVLAIGSDAKTLIEIIKDINYINLVYEVLILSFIFIFFMFNKWIYELINEQEVKKYG